MNPAFVAFGLASQAITNGANIMGNAQKAAVAFDNLTNERDLTNEHAL